MPPKTICIDFDGTIVSYAKGWQGVGVYGELLPGAAESINKLKQGGWKIVIFTTRNENEQIANFLQKNNIPFDEINYNSDNPENTNKGKPIADVYLDDRVVTFTGNWDQSYQDILVFKPWEDK